MTIKIDLRKGVRTYAASYTRRIAKSGAHPELVKSYARWSGQDRLGGLSIAH